MNFTYIKDKTTYEIRMSNGAVECVRIERNACRVISRRFKVISTIRELCALIHALEQEGYTLPQDQHDFAMSFFNTFMGK